MNDIYKPLVSVVIPTYKRGEMLPRAINSILNQTYMNVEVIVIDDNNPKTADRQSVRNLMKEYSANPLVRYIEHEKNKNGSAARNTGIKHSKGKYVCFLDDDNYFYPEKIEKEVSYLKKNVEYKAVYSGLQYEKKQIIPTQKGDLRYEQLLGNMIIDTNMIMMEREIINEFGGWDERLSRNQDVAFMLRYFDQGYKIGVIPEPLAYIDMSDRTNVAKPEISEKNFDDFLMYYDHYIKNCKIDYNKAKREIYSSRYRGVLLSYIKSNQYINASKLYCKMLWKYPVTFNKYLIVGALRKLRGKSLY